MTHPIARLASGLAVGVLACSTSVSAQQCSGNISAGEALRAEDARYAATTARDLRALTQLVGDDLVYVHSTAAVDDKNALLAKLRDEVIRYTGFQRIEELVRVYGCVAIISGSLNVEALVRGQPIKAKLRFTSIWVKRASATEWVSFQGIPIRQE